MPGWRTRRVSRWPRRRERGGPRPVRGGRGEAGDRLGVRGVGAVGGHEGVLADRGGVEELLGAGAAQRAGGGLADHGAQAEALEGALVGAALLLVGGV